LITVTLFNRGDCHLCDEAKADLDALQDKFPHRLVVVDIDENPDLLEAYALEVPVIKVGPYTLKAPFDRQKLEMTLGAAQDRRKQLTSIEGEDYQRRVDRGQAVSRTDKFSYWLAKHYLFVFNLFVFLYVGLPFLAPVMMKVGWIAPAGVIYRVYGGLCHQLAYRSWFLFGEQPFYPREIAGLEGYLSLQEATGIDEYGVWEARSYIGNDVVGYKVALCQRDIAIYGSILLFGLIFGLTGRRFKPLPILLWLLIGLVPIGVDGVSQLGSQLLSDPFFDFLQPIFGFLSYRESTPFLRTLTGFLFGFTTAWFGYPLVEETMADARRLLVTKFAHAKVFQAGQIDE
jgi:uncharacterized membrane protein